MNRRHIARSLAGIAAPMRSFDDSRVYDDAAVLARWLDERRTGRRRADGSPINGSTSRRRCEATPKGVLRPAACSRAAERSRPVRMPISWRGSWTAPPWRGAREQPSARRGRASRWWLVRS